MISKSETKESSLRGSSILSGLKASKGISRIDHYLANVSENKVVNFYKKDDICIIKAEDIVKENFSQYRKSWFEQPKAAINN